MKVTQTHYPITITIEDETDKKQLWAVLFAAELYLGARRLDKNIDITHFQDFPVTGLSAVITDLQRNL